MNWKLILQLSLFGLAMGIATVFVIASAVEPFCWLAVFLVSAYAIARGAPGRPFLHGVYVGLANSVWVTGAHILFVDQYLARHPREVAMMSSMPLPTHPRIMMALTGPSVGVVSGFGLGVTAGVRPRRMNLGGGAPAPTAGGP